MLEALPQRVGAIRQALIEREPLARHQDEHAGGNGGLADAPPRDRRRVDIAFEGSMLGVRDNQLILHGCP